MAELRGGDSGRPVGGGGGNLLSWGWGRVPGGPDGQRGPQGGHKSWEEPQEGAG